MSESEIGFIALMILFVVDGYFDMRRSQKHAETVFEMQREIQKYKLLLELNTAEEVAQ